MATRKGKIESEEYNNDPVIEGNKSVWFLNGDLVRPRHYSRSQGLVTVYNINKNRLETLLVRDFKRSREKAYTISQTAKLINRHRKYMPSLVKRGVIPPAIGSTEGGKTGWQIRSYYSESQVRDIRDTLASIHIGQPRKDGLVTNNMTPNRQELTHRMGEGILIYTKTSDGRFIPTWKEMI